jgi:hypothetical protein
LQLLCEEQQSFDDEIDGRRETTGEEREAQLLWISLAEMSSYQSYVSDVDLFIWHARS